MLAASTNQEQFTVKEDLLTLKYHAVVQEIGPMVEEFLPHGILIFFGAAAPAELREVSVIHNGSELIAPLQVGDMLKLAASQDGEDNRPQPGWFRITALGDMANTNLAELGHLVIHFDGATTPNLPGTVSVEPSLEALPQVGAIFELYGLEEK
jgi:glucitol/sorbitol PTS system EIIA component